MFSKENYFGIVTLANFTFTNTFPEYFSTKKSVFEADFCRHRAVKAGGVYSSTD